MQEVRDGHQCVELSVASQQPQIQGTLCWCSDLHSSVCIFHLAPTLIHERTFPLPTGRTGPTKCSDSSRGLLETLLVRTAGICCPCPGLRASSRTSSCSGHVPKSWGSQQGWGCLCQGPCSSREGLFPSSAELLPH